MSIMYYNRHMEKKKEFEVHVMIDLKLYRKLKGLLALDGKTLKGWFTEIVTKEVDSI